MQERIFEDTTSVGDKIAAAMLLSTTSVAWFSVFATVSYVAPFYLFTSTRPSPTTSRDDPAVIRGRVRCVVTSCALVLLAVIFLLQDFEDVLHLLGWFPIGFMELGKAMILICLLFAGPLYERGFVDEGWKDLSLPTTWIGWRTYLAGPITEELMFRSALLPLALTSLSPVQSVFITPLYFGIAHVHHAYEASFSSPPAVLIVATIFQFCYTTIFGWFEAFVFLRTGSLVTCIALHSFCNLMGLPRLWGRLEGRYGVEDLSIWWTVAYYVLLFLGAGAFWKYMWILTESENALAVF